MNPSIGGKAATKGAWPLPGFSCRPVLEYNRRVMDAGGLFFAAVAKPFTEGSFMFKHSYPFDPTYGYDLEALLCIEGPVGPEDFAEFWKRAYGEAMEVFPKPEIADTGKDEKGWRQFDLRYRSTEGFEIGGWLLAPTEGLVRRGIVIGHGYGGRDGPDFHLDFPETALIFPCFRGLSRSAVSPISREPRWHVLHDLDKRDRYIHRGCVQDIWVAVSALLRLFPQTKGHIGYMGISFGGGIGGLALPWDTRIERAHFNVPSSGNQPLRLILPTTGAAASEQEFSKRFEGDLLSTLLYYDSAVAARYIHVPVHCACALFDPVVPPPGQFSVYNALRGPKELYVLEAGHFDYPQKEIQEQELIESLLRFFASL